MLYGVKNPHGGDRYGDGIALDFSANVSPLGTPKCVTEAIERGLPELYRYPDPYCRALVQAIAHYEGVPGEFILCGNGASELIYAYCEAVRPGRAMELAPTFSEYSLALQRRGCGVVRFALSQEEKFDLQEHFLARLAHEKIDALFLCNPNNPTGTYVPIGELEAFADTLPEDVLLVMDEAYMEFATEPDCCSMVDYMKAHLEKPILVLRTFSKYYAMAGLRVGYALGSEELIGILRKCSASWNLNVCAQKAAVAGLADQEYYQEQKAKIVEGREYLEKEMAALGCRVYPSQSNFIYFDTGKDPAWIQEQLMEKGIRIGAFEMSRVSVGTMEECKLYIKALKEILEAAE